MEGIGLLFANSKVHVFLSQRASCMIHSLLKEWNIFAEIKLHFGPNWKWQERVVGGWVVDLLFATRE